MDPSALPTLITLGGAAGALFYVLKLLVDGRLHTTSEVDGLRMDKQHLLAANARLSSGIEKSNALLADVLDILRDRAKATRAPEGRSER